MKKRITINIIFINIMSWAEIGDSGCEDCFQTKFVTKHHIWPVMFSDHIKDTAKGIQSYRGEKDTPSYSLGYRLLC